MPLLFSPGVHNQPCRPGRPVTESKQQALKAQNLDINYLTHTPIYMSLLSTDNLSYFLAYDTTVVNIGPIPLLVKTIGLIFTCFNNVP